MIPLQQEMQLVNLEAEQSVIGAILLQPDIIKDCYLNYLDFYDSRHKMIFFIMKDLDDKGKPIDVVSIAERGRLDGIEKCGGVTYIAELAGAIPTTANFNYYQGIVKEYRKKRQQYEIATTIMQETFEKEPAAVRSDAIDALLKLDEDNDEDNDDGHISKVMLKVFDWMEQEHGDITGAPTGFKDLDRLLSGFQKQDFVIIGARPSMGKTAFALNIAQNYALLNGPVGVFSLEMPDEGLGKRMLSSEGNIDAQAMRNPMKSFSSSEWHKATEAMGALSKTPFHIFDKPGVNMDYIRRKCRMMKRKYPDKHIVIFIDYLQLIVGNPKHGGNRTAEISEISRQLKQTARELDMTICALSQLSRNVEQRQDKRPMMSDLRESGQIEQDADVIGFLYRDDYYDKESEAKNLVEVIIAKQRNGPIGTVTLAFKKEYNKFINIDWSQGKK